MPVSSLLITVSVGITTTIVSNLFSGPDLSAKFGPMKNCIIFTFFISIFMHLAPLEAATKISCSHPELCRLAKIIFTENHISNFEFENLVQIKGDPHEFEPTTAEVKKLISAEILISGPLELNPWIKKINYQRLKLTQLKTINLPLEDKDYAFYPGANHEALSHFWLYPKIFCSLKNSMEDQLIAFKYLIVTPKNKSCAAEEKIITTTLFNSIVGLKIPIVLTHDALLPLFESVLGKERAGLVVAIKGSGHHQEASPSSVKKLYDILKSPKVVWILEDKIHVPQNILSKKRATDLILNLDTANSEGLDYFQILYNLNDKLQALKK